MLHISVSPGVCLGPYTILGPLGAGGMGQVYRARDTRLDREVAIKMLPDDVAGDEHALARLEKEARAVAALSHPNILALYDVGRQDDRSFLVTELLEGMTLQDALARGPISLKAAMDVAREIAEALAAAHEKGVIHRDVKPANIFITRDGHAKLLDFGLARSTARTSSVDTDAHTVDKQTAPNVVVGTAAYMSPEQARGEAVDFRSDQFALGAVLYEMLTGASPFRKSSTAETLAAIIREEPVPAAQLNAAVPMPLDWLVQRCLSKEPRERYASTRDLASELQGLRVHLSETRGASSGATRSARRLPLAFWALPLAAVVALIVYVDRTRPAPVAVTARPGPPVRLSLSLPLDADPQRSGNFNPLALSPDGRRLVYAGKQLFVRTLERDEVRPMEGTDGGTSPFFSPDGNWVAFFADAKLKKVPVEGGLPITLCDIPKRRSATFGAGSWGPDGTIVFMPSYYSGLQVIASSGGRPRALTTPALALESHSFPQVLPDGEHVLFERDEVGPKSLPTAVVVSRRTGALKVVAEEAAYPLYLSPGFLVFTRRGTLLAMPFDLKKLEATGLAVPVLDDLVTNRRWTNAAHLAVSAEGTLVYHARGTFQRNLVWVDRAGNVDPLPFPPANYLKVALSPDRARVAVLAADKDETIRLLIGDLERGTLTRAPAEGLFQSAVWTPDGKRIVLDFCATSQDLGRLHWLPADGSGPPEPLTPTDSRRHETPTSFSPDGHLLLFDVVDLTNPAGSETGWDILGLPFDSAGKTRPVVVSRFDERSGSFSPDGRWIAYQSNESGRVEVFIKPFSGSGSKWQISTDGGTSPLWSRDGRQLFYRNGEQLLSVTFDGTPRSRPGRTRLLARGPFVESYDVDPSLDRFLMIRRDAAESGPPRLSVVLNWFDELKRMIPASR